MKMELELRGMLAWVLPPSLACWAIGAWPMYRYGGHAMEAQACALAAALAVMVARVGILKMVIARAKARKPPANLAFVASQAFLAAGMVTMVVLAGLGAALWYLLSLPGTPFFLWLIGFYLIMLTAETWWLTRLLKNLSPGTHNNADAGNG